ncbi:hypothetical protein PanWU01x14_110260 [Parasponia andersonii]|uniref:Uncharacterized protein n=1 Tax=Parasponia andersonii TaxID=3476 RepID=A0A2P5CZA6_PARAD|nr:hypothetical protein PanWU01x14_110260 [Parasponia andersonii]
MEFDWKLLGTAENLIASGLFPKGVALGQGEDLDLLTLFHQLPKKVGLSAVFIDHFTLAKGWEKMRSRPLKVVFHAAIRMLANTAVADVLIYDLILKCVEKGKKIKEIAQTN